MTWLYLGHTKQLFSLSAIESIINFFIYFNTVIDEGVVSGRNINFSNDYSLATVRGFSGS